MTHKESAVKVYTTTNYNLFEMVEGNRALNKNKIARIIKEINDGNDILDKVPILVKEVSNKLGVLDGQHRLEICKILGRPVNYILQKNDMNLYAVAKVNSNTEKWTAGDFIKCYIAAGNKNYVQIEKFHKGYGFSVGVCLTLLTFGITRGDNVSKVLLNQFEQGVFEVKKYKEAVQTAEILKQFELFEGWKTRGFVIAIVKILQAEKCDFEILLKKFNSDPKKLVIQGNWKSYLTNLEEIYNIGNSKRRTIF